MTVKNNDFLFLLVGIILAGLAALALSSPDAIIGLYGVAGMLGIVMVLAIIIKPNFGATILIIAIFTNISAQLTDHGYPAVVKPLVAVVFGAIMVRNYYAGQLPKDRKKTAAIETFIIMYFAVITMSYLVAADKNRALDAVLDMGKDIIIIYTILFALREWRTWKQAIWVIILTTAALSMLGVYQVVTGDHAQDFFGLSTVQAEGILETTDATSARVSGPVHDPNMWAQIIVPVMALVLFQIMHEPRVKLKILGVGILAALLIVLLNTYSRGGYLAFMVVGFLTFFVFEKRIHPLVAVAGLGLLVLLIPFLPADYRSRFESLSFLSDGSSGVYQDSSLQGRSSVMLSGLTMFAYNPLLGVGASNFMNNYQKYNQIVGLEFKYGEREAHSLYTQILAETGILGGVSFFGIMASLLSGLAKTVKSIQNLPAYKSYIHWVVSLQVAIVGYLVAATFLHDAFIRYFWILVALALTAIQLIDERLNSMDRSKFLEDSL
ncbi:MAG: O-antigen ligase family protein [Chloroflexota bacterium]